MSQLFHRDLGFAPIVTRALCRLATSSFRPRYSMHSLRAALDDRYGPFVPPARITINVPEVVEVEISGLCITKVVVRIPCPKRDGFDLMLALTDFAADTVTVKTCWLNRTTDTHTTLDASKYVQP